MICTSIAVQAKSWVMAIVTYRIVCDFGKHSVGVGEI